MLQHVIDDRLENTNWIFKRKSSREQVEASKRTLRDLKLETDILFMYAGRYRDKENQRIKAEIYNRRHDQSQQISQPSSKDSAIMYIRQLAKVRTKIKDVQKQAEETKVKAQSEKWDPKSTTYWHELSQGPAGLQSLESDLRAEHGVIDPL